MHSDQARHFALFYDVVDDYVARGTAFRDQHLALVQEAHQRGEIVMAGAFADPVDGTLLVFRATGRAVVEAFARSDPYVINGLVTRWHVRDWSVVPLVVPLD